MAKFAYNNAMNTSTDYTSFKLNYDYYPCIFYEKNVKPCYQSKSADVLVNQPRKIMVVCRKNFQHALNL